MAQRKETQKNVYRKTFANTECICRFCCGVYDPKHTKNIYHKANVKLLVLAETVFEISFRMKTISLVSYVGPVKEMPELSFFTAYTPFYWPTATLTWR